ncbi:hypothetical protein J9303_02600 [Bacillaceae bacterium Marseille-Q3522]|nr:hypothetical protein [Bacillaceae bacterium Marseille-Q3522]
MEAEIADILEKLKSGELSEYYVKKDDFLLFQKYLITRPDFKHFRGIAQRGGNILYRYTEKARS